MDIDVFDRHWLQEAVIYGKPKNSEVPVLYIDTKTKKATDGENINLDTVALACCYDKQWYYNYEAAIKELEFNNDKLMDAKQLQEEKRDGEGASDVILRVADTIKLKRKGILIIGSKSTVRRRNINKLAATYITYDDKVPLLLAVKNSSLARGSITDRNYKGINSVLIQVVALPNNQ